MWCYCSQIIELLHKAIEDERNELVALATSTESANVINQEINKMNDEVDHIQEEMLAGNADKFVADFLPSLRQKLDHMSQPPPEAKQPVESDSFDESKEESSPKKSSLAKVAFGAMMRRTMLLRMKSGSRSSGAVKIQDSAAEEKNEVAKSEEPPAPTVPGPVTASLPAAGRMTFLGFSKFMVALQRRIQFAMTPPELSEKVNSVFHNSVQFEISSDKCCTGDLIYLFLRDMASY
jgi:hypothetical protein